MSAIRSVAQPEPTPASSGERELLSNLLAVRGFGVISLDVEGKILVCNAAAAQVMGVSVAEIVGRSPNEFAELSAEGGPLTPDLSPLQIAIQTKRPYQAGTLKITRRDGSHRWLRIETLPVLDDAGGVHRVIATLIDVTASHDAEGVLRVERRRLARSGDRFRRVLESVPDAIAVYHEQRVGYANAALVRLFGYESVAELIGKDVTKALPGHTPRGAPSGGPGLLREESWRRVDGTVAVVEIAAHSIDVDGDEGTLLIARDITERKRAQTELMQSSRLASVGTLAAGVAHEINNPLTYIIANLELMTEELGRCGDGVPSARVEALLSLAEDARSGAESVRRIVRGLKIFSRADEERRSTLDVCAVMTAAMAMAHNEIRHRARLVREYGSVPRVDADEGRLGQVFINLLVNAAQAIPEGHVEANEIRVVTSTDEVGRAVIEVHDTGDGIPPEVLGRIFDPFFTTKAIGIGTGLGLSICHGLVTELGGELRVASVVGAGTVFRVVLPAAKGELTVVAAEPAAATGTAGRRARVLIIDDDPSVAEALRKVLAREHDVVVDSSGASALQRISGGETFDVILCDLMMPEMTGMSFHAELATIAPTLSGRVVFITGGAFSPGAGAFLDGVPNQRLEKPCDLRTLRRVVRAFVPTTD